ncbi:MAG: iron ABC transporter permease [Oceanospirillales bacterium]|nr:MAG: iron ABC transporter permease [Oceanospirillales bacterium]
MSSQSAIHKGYLSSLRSRLHLDFWTLGSLLIALIVLLPIFAVFYLAMFPTENIWPHLISTVLPGYIKNTLWLMLGVCIGTFIIGTGTAWLVTMCRFPGRRVFEWALLIPLAMPAYVVAYVYTDLLNFSGPVQSMLRETFGWRTPRDYWFPNIRSLGGAISMMVLVLYPYVYLLSRSAFLEQSATMLEASRTLGCSTWQSFIRVGLPIARPSIVVGVVLALMEALNDFGTVDYFAVRTLTAGIFNVWFHMRNLGGGAQIAVVLLIFIVVLILIERFARRKKRYHSSTRSVAPPRIHLTGWKAVAAVIACTLPILLGLIIPGAQLVAYSIKFYEASISAGFFVYAKNSLILSAVAALVAVTLGLFLAYAGRLGKGPFLSSCLRLVSLGYAVPGAVLAVGILYPFGYFDNFIDAIMFERFGISTGLLFSGSMFILIYAYVARFLALSYGTVEAGLTRIRPNLDGAARTLGRSPSGVLRDVHVPILRGSLGTAAILVFVDTMKELPATLILRPFNFNTLATHVYQYAKDEQIEIAALGSLTIVLVGLIPTILLSYTISQSRSGGKSK